MKGPYSLGTYSQLPPPTAFGWERTGPARGKTYRVTQAFRDADGHEHLPGETWMFLGGMFNKFDDEWTLCVRFASGEEWRIPLGWGADRQENVLEHWQDYLEQEDSATARGAP